MHLLTLKYFESIIEEHLILVKVKINSRSEGPWILNSQILSAVINKHYFVITCAFLHNVVQCTVYAHSHTGSRSPCQMWVKYTVVQVNVKSRTNRTLDCVWLAGKRGQSPPGLQMCKVLITGLTHWLHIDCSTLMSPYSCVYFLSIMNTRVISVILYWHKCTSKLISQPL